MKFLKLKQDTLKDICIYFDGVKTWKQNSRKMTKWLKKKKKGVVRKGIHVKMKNGDTLSAYEATSKKTNRKMTKGGRSKRVDPMLNGLWLEPQSRVRDRCCSGAELNK